MGNIDERILLEFADAVVLLRVKPLNVHDRHYRPIEDDQAVAF